MTRNIINRVLAVLAMSLLTLAGGCGGGGGSSSPSKLIYGTASKGILYPGSVSVYGVDSAGVRAASPLATVVTDSSGKFAADIGAYSGTLLIEATGSYTDEATGNTVTIGAARPMKAAVSGVNAATTRRFAITPLTDLAVSLAGTLTATNIDAANQRVSSLFKISDITAVEPVQPAAVAMAAATMDQQSYTLALASLSQMAKAANSSPASFTQIVTILTAFKSDLDASATAGLGTGNKNAFATALGVVTSSTLSGFSAAAANLGAVGTRTLTLTLATSGVPVGTLVGGVQGTITLPAGTSLRLDPVVSGSVLASLFVLSGNAGQSLLSNTVNGPAVTFGIINATGFASGDIATLVVDISSGAPTAADFALSGITVLDNSNNPVAIGGATVTVR
jgi:hypothetical protein